MGEEARSRGIGAERRGLALIRALGYRIHDLLDEQFDIDCIAEFESIPRFRGMLRPRFSPSGLTAFEITSQRISETKFTSFGEKITCYNDAHSDAPVSGGVLLTDKPISNPMYARMRSQGIFGWGQTRVAFYWNKVRTFNSWKAFGAVTEIALDEATSYLRCFSPNAKQLFRFSVFFDDHTHVMTPAKTRLIMEGIRRQSLEYLISQGLTPLNVWFEYHALSDIDDLTEDLLSFVDEWRRAEIVVFIPKDAFKGYRTFPVLSL